MFTNTLFRKEKNNLRTMAQGESWLNRLERIIKDNATDPNFGNEQLAEKLEVSKRDLFRKVKKNTNHSPSQYIQKYRLQLAMDYLQNGKYRTVNEAANAIGYANVGYFISLFKKEYGKTPLVVLQENGWR